MLAYINAIVTNKNYTFHVGTSLSVLFVLHPIMKTTVSTKIMFDSFL